MAEKNQFVFASDFPCSARSLYNWHTREGALERLIPPWENTRVITRQGGIAPGATTVLRMHAGPIPFTYRARHIADQPGHLFEDTQEKGPFAALTHTHSFTDTTTGARLEEKIQYRLPGQFFLPKHITTHVEETLRRVFTYRHQTLLDDVKLHNYCSTKPLRVLMTGASGVLGQAVIPLLTTGGHEVWTLVRRQPDPAKQEIHWDPEKGIIDSAALPKIDGVIHLAGDSLLGSRWTKVKKQRVIDSRVQGTELLARTLAEMASPPKVMLSASAVGYYGNCLECAMTEEDNSGLDFISDVCAMWERAARPAQQSGIRTVFMRIGVVLTPRGGALQDLLRTGSIGFFSSFGKGDQYISWISVDDMISAMLHALTSDDLIGPVNIAAPEPVTNRQLMQTLADVMHRPLLPSIPAGMLKMLYGDMASEVMLSGCRVSTRKLQESGYQFRHDSLEKALRCLLGRSK